MSFFYSQLFVRPSYPNTDFSDQTVIVTGSNVGLGKEAARHFVRLNAKRVILAVRNLDGGQDAKTDIERTTHRTGIVQVWKLDLGSYASVRDFGSRVFKELDRVDVLVENAGIAAKSYRLAEDNESTVTVNLISTIYLALLLLPKLQEAAEKFKSKPRLAIVVSEVHAWAKFPQRTSDHILEELNDESKADMADRYNVSKLLQVLVIRQIAPLIAKSNNKDVILTMLNPGLCQTGLAREDDSWSFYIFKLLMARTAEVGSRTLVAAVSVGEDAHGKYMSDGLVEDSGVVEWVRGTEGDRAGKELWHEVRVKLEKIHPGVTKNLE